MSFTYDDNGLRTSKTVNGITTEYYWNGNLLVAEQTPYSLTVYNYDATGRPIGMSYRENTYGQYQWDVYWFDLNLQGDIIAVYSKTGTKLASYSYAPNTYRFINADGYLSTGQGILGYNMYAYCRNNSLNVVDDFMKWIDKKHLFINLITSVLNNGERHAEVITDKPKELIDAIYEDADRISMVIFWDRASVKEGSSIGYGGPLDSRDHDYYFAETEEILSVLPNATKEELLNYIGIIQSKYSTKLYVGFMVDLTN